MSETMPSEYCPKCGDPRSAVRLDSGFGLVREYQCRDCRATWSVNGRQESLLELMGAEEVLTLNLE